MTGLEIAAALFTVASGAVSAAGAMSAASAQKKSAFYEAQVADRNAKIARQQADTDAQDQRRENLRQMGAIRAAYGATGIDIAGSPLDVLADTAAEQELDVTRTEYKGTMRALQETDKRNLAITEGRNAMKAGQVSALGQAIKAGSSLFSLPGIKGRLTPAGG